MNEHLIADLLFKIKLLESQEKDKGRKIKLEDLSSNKNTDNLTKIKEKNNKEKIKDYRQQEEFGEKKFIKP